MKPPALKLDHVVFPIRDPERTLAFYRDVLELPLIEALTGDDWDGYPWLMMIFGLAGGQELVTVALKGARLPDYRGLPMDVRHYALSAADETEMDHWCARLSQEGVDFWEERHGERRSLYFPDPDGVILEITWPPSKGYGVPSPEAALTVQRWLKAKVPA
ncbi:MAG: Glyoxalase/bleomycin resistance protein/dioxygenase [Phenylobacterium sp.]|nr:Glyoxalase/bleomycin resistance protein/dioxygenase [Phenylobacterium sp.]MDB5495484.1 Glyoxalase/bleomycin resistance protein/dioxygenase [Phenylobacterium sp.]